LGLISLLTFLSRSQPTDLFVEPLCNDRSPFHTSKFEPPVRKLQSADLSAHVCKVASTKTPELQRNHIHSSPKALFQSADCAAFCAPTNKPNAQGFGNLGYDFIILDFTKVKEIWKGHGCSMRLITTKFEVMEGVLGSYKSLGRQTGTSNLCLFLLRGEKLCGFEGLEILQHSLDLSVCMLDFAMCRQLR
jgi:hypothetical protein